MILVLVENTNGTISDASFEALSVAAGIAAASETSVEALFVGVPDSDVALKVGQFGADVLRSVGDPRLGEYAPGAWAKAIVEIATEVGVEAVVAPGSDRGNDVMARSAARAGAPFIANCIAITPGAPYQVSRLRWAGSLIEDSELSFEGTKFFSISLNSQSPKPDPTRSAAQVKPQPLELSDLELRDAVVETMLPQSDHISLSDSRVVVGGGRGVGSPEGFAALDELATLLGGVVGVSRVVTSVGWRPHRDQIGQTGTRIAPDLYVACGISGAIQHMAGCRGAKCILAINTDRDAPIMSSADYVVVGDLHQILPRLVEELKSRTS